MEGEQRAEAAALKEVRSALERLQGTLTGSLYVRASCKRRPSILAEVVLRHPSSFIHSCRQDLEAMAEKMERFAALNRAWAVVFEGEPPLDEEPV